MQFNISDDQKYKNGVYMIECVSNGMQYIGSVYRKKHKCLYHQGFFGRYNQYTSSKQFNKKIQNCINKYGFNSLVMKLVESVDEEYTNEYVRSREIFYMKYYNTVNSKHGLNLKLNAAGGNGGANKGKKYPKLSQQVVEKRASKIRGRPKPLRTSEHRNNQSKALKGKPSSSSLRYLIILKCKNGELITLNSISDIKKFPEIGLSFSILRRHILGLRCGALPNFVEVYSVIKLS